MVRPLQSSQRLRGTATTLPFVALMQSLSGSQRVPEATEWPCLEPTCSHHFAATRRDKAV